MGQLQLLEEHLAELLGGVDVEGMAGDGVNLLFQLLQPLVQLGRHLLEEVHVDSHPLALDVHEHVYQRHLDFEHPFQPLGPDLRGERLPEAQGHVGVGGPVRGDLLDRKLGHRLLGLAGADELGNLGHLHAEAVARQPFEAFELARRVGQPFGNHRVEDEGRDFDAIAAQDHQVVFGVVGQLGQVGIGQRGAQRVEHGLQRKLALGQPPLGLEERHLPVNRVRLLLGEMADRDIVALRRADGEADAYEVGGHLVQARRLDVEAELFGRFQPFDEGL